MSNNNYEMISPTAMLVAHMRTFTDIPFAKEIANASGAENYFQSIIDNSPEPNMQSVPLSEARYKSTNKIIAQHGITQILEIAAGLSPRGLAMTENPDVIFVAADLPQILKQIKAVSESILVRLNITRPNLYFKTANALNQTDLLEAAAPFQAAKPIAIITEGLLPYLKHEEKETMALNIKELLKRYKGIWITSDVNTIQSWRGMANTDEKMQEWMKNRMRNLSSMTGRNMVNNIFRDEAEVQQFFTNAGFMIQDYPHTNVFEELASLDRLHLDRDAISEILKIYKSLILTSAA
ncbi:MAG: hypothetical protein ACM3UZ_16580 [Acidobacteriota bacterium]